MPPPDSSNSNSSSSNSSSSEQHLKRTSSIPVLGSRPARSGETSRGSSSTSSSSTSSLRGSSASLAVDRLAQMGADERATLNAHVCLKLGAWQRTLLQQHAAQAPDGGAGETAMCSIVVCLREATELRSDWYKAWHAYALMNFEVLTHYERQGVPGSAYVAYTIAAIQAFFKSIALDTDQPIQDALRILTLMFKHGAQPEVEATLVQGFNFVSVDTWLEVIPQIIARIGSQGAVGRLANMLLSAVGNAHPHALAYPLAVSIKSDQDNNNNNNNSSSSTNSRSSTSSDDGDRDTAPGEAWHARSRSEGFSKRTSATLPRFGEAGRAKRPTPARELMQRMRARVPTLVEQTLLVSRELLRVAILWHESWHGGLEEASRVYFNSDGGGSGGGGSSSSSSRSAGTEEGFRRMMAVLEPLHAMVEARPPESLREVSFVESYGRDLHDAHEFCRRYAVGRCKADIDEAWYLYTQVFRKLNAQLPQLTVLNIANVSPQLARQRNMELAVPGTYCAGRPVVRIARVDPSVTVITSKQRPRKLTIVGSNGVDYKFLLKGHEDLRQDERVMQLFGLVNNLLANDSETSKQRAAITRYAVVPLSPNSGLIGWVPHCDTLHGLIREYRDARHIVLNTEHRAMLQAAPNFEKLTVPQKVEVFEHAISTTDGQDLEHVLWLKSATSEAWLERRTCYTRTLALMSMVGYILGLGDRHPSNIMLDRSTGQVVHIDFGDCFEVAMHRDKFPERIPFRLTRMLVNAMEVSGIEGSYRFTCEKVMRVLRTNKDSLMAVLEAFVYDPLINWRLLSRPPQQQQQQLGQQKGPSDAGSFGAPSSLSSDTLSTDACTTTTTSAASVGGGAGGETEEEEMDHDPLNRRALSVIKRVSKKLTGCDFGSATALDVKEQVSKLIEQATSHENLCQCYVGWCPFW